MGYGMAILLIFVAVVGLILVDYRFRKGRPKSLGQADSEAATIMDPLVLLQRENPDLPMVPPSNSVYEVWETWFQQALRQVTIGSVRRTREATLKLNDQLLRYQLQCLTYLENKQNIREVGALADLDLEAKKHALLYQIAKSKADIEDLKNPRRSSRPHLDV
jgi:hypothetical protein